MLFVPGGYWHRCESGFSTSVHLGIFFLPPTAWHVIDQTIRPLITDEFFRRPRTRLNEENALATVEADLKKRLIAKSKIWTSESSCRDGGRKLNEYP